MKTCLICWGGNALPALFISLPVILVIFAVEEVTCTWAYAFFAWLLDYNRVVVWNFRSPALWVYLCMIQISIPKGSYLKKKTTTTVLSIKYSNVPIMHLFNCYSFSDVFVASILWSSSHVTPLRNLLKSMNTLISRISALSSLLHFSDTGMSVFSWVRNTVT